MALRSRFPRYRVRRGARKVRFRSRFLAVFRALTNFRKALSLTDLCLASSKMEVMNASEMARALGRRGGRARGTRLSAAARKRIASLGGKARSQSLKASGRIVDNFRYAAVLDDLRGRPATVRRLSAFAGPLPGIYLAGS